MSVLNFSNEANQGCRLFSAKRKSENVCLNNLKFSGEKHCISSIQNAWWSASLDNFIIHPFLFGKNIESGRPQYHYQYIQYASWKCQFAGFSLVSATWCNPMIGWYIPHSSHLCGFIPLSLTPSLEIRGWQEQAKPGPGARTITVRAFKWIIHSADMAFKAGKFGRKLES